MKMGQSISHNEIETTAYYNFSTNTSSAISSDDNSYVEINEMENILINEEAVGKYSVFDIANWFLLKEEMSPKKLQKLCYYAQAWCYALKGYRLENTDFQAWVHGPVSPALWERFKSFGYETIKINGECHLAISEEDQRLLEDVWDTYGDRTGNALETLSHRELPWIEARRGYASNERCSVVISPDTMATYYKMIYSGN